MSNDYVVQPGDTLSSIARRHGCSISVLQSANHIADPRKLRVGTHLQLPTTRQRPETQRPVDASLQPPTMPPPAPSTSYVQELIQTIRDADGEVTEQVQGVVQKVVRIGHGLGEAVLQWLREVESTQTIHASAKTTSDRRPQGQQRRPTTPHRPATAARRHKDEVIAELHARLFATPHVVATSGVTLSRNERRMIVAAVGLCEVNSDVFGSSNEDYEFKGRKFGQKKIETPYSRIVHIGLSYGYIQCTQDGGSLGALLVKMQQKNRKLFESFFPNAALLIQLTTQGLPGHDHYGVSGQAYWNHLSASQKHALQTRANTDANGDNQPDNPLTDSEEIRGARVQRIPYVQGYSAIDLWEDYSDKPRKPDGIGLYDYSGYLAAFKAAGDVPAFQDVQLDFAVDNYANLVLARCQQWRVRSSIGLAFIFACAVRGGPLGSLPKLLINVASARAGSQLTSFESARHERDCVQAVADCYDPHQRRATIGSGSTAVSFDMDEARRAKMLLADQYHFLTEDLYDLGTYDAAHDH